MTYVFDWIVFCSMNSTGYYCINAFMENTASENESITLEVDIDLNNS